MALNKIILAWFDLDFCNSTFSNRIDFQFEPEVWQRYITMFIWSGLLPKAIIQIDFTNL